MVLEIEQGKSLTSVKHGGAGGVMGDTQGRGKSRAHPEPGNGMLSMVAIGVADALAG